MVSPSPSATPSPVPHGSASAAATAPAGHPVQTLPVTGKEAVDNVPDADVPVEIDTDENDTFDTDSAVGSEGGFSDTTSLSSSIVNYKYENGRTYHAFRDGKYIMPNDDKEQDRLDLVHHVWRLMLRGELYRAPISQNVQRVLDIGTGTGIWAMEFADEFPSATIIANDLSPIQPTWVPPNLQFEIDDAEDEWPYNSPFDYVHIRNMGASIADWPKLCAQSLHHLRPGGWIEIQEHTAHMYSEDGEISPNTKEWLEKVAEAAKAFGKELSDAQTVTDIVTSAGFEDVHQDVYKVPLGTWPKNRRMKELGRYHQAACVESVEAYSLALFTRVLGWDVNRLQVFLAAVRNELKDPKNHFYCHTYVVYGRKPLK